MSSPTSPLEYISPWVVSQRWFASKGRVPRLESIGSWEIPSDGPRIVTHLIMDFSARVPVLYQVPVTERAEPLDGAENALIAEVATENGTTYLYDGPHDPAYATALLRMISASTEATAHGATAHGQVFGAIEFSEILSSSVLRGEQSNTSIIYSVVTDSGIDSVICKVFRALHHGENPDVVLQAALAASGSPNVPQSIGAVVGEWNDIGRANGRALGHLAFAQEFLAGSEDAWRFALRSAEEMDDFTERAYSLGTVTAEVHTLLAGSLGTTVPSRDEIDSTLASWRSRLLLAIDEVPAIDEFRDTIEALYASTASLDWPPLQRIHGDYHLGQVLLASDGHWVLLDFEGEPMRPMEERSRFDFALRDVAGMLRSFDYVAGSLGSTEDAQSWTRASRNAFLSGYIERSGNDLRTHRELLDAFEMDKALYEAVYEARNRPDWLPIPLAALGRLARRQR
ncbi:maltokinase N-terminal cap-like domain-containing protein [Mycetocola zhadangensis]|uniref:Maltokinase n=1 Tax=Mycetocola zhadangensis TaxID=1164595 RepID=A0A3L7J6P3_9MICO|nr:phosphotransferase [Mycetocola zhadangensis]RLQ86333.1 phosphotransferase [Mycetocola zhadangensis]GGE90253.1 trehalose biosynthesis protein [Mycetocola zhadangensis]